MCLFVCVWEIFLSYFKDKTTLMAVLPPPATNQPPNPQDFIWHLICNHNFIYSFTWTELDVCKLLFYLILIYFTSFKKEIIILLLLFNQQSKIWKIEFENVYSPPPQNLERYFYHFFYLFFITKCFFLTSPLSGRFALVR